MTSKPAAMALLILATSTLIHARPPHPPACLPKHPIINIRLPPKIDPNVDTSPPAWEPMPPAWYYGDWYVAYSSNAPYQALRDLIWSLAPVLPTCINSTPASCAPGTFPGQLSDLSTWFAKDDTAPKAYTSAFAFDTPRRVNNASAGPGWVDTWDTVGTGQLSYFQQGWQILAWGEDGDGVGFMVNYELAVEAKDTPPCLDILSRVAEGPDQGTVDAVYKAVRGVGNRELDGLLGKVQRLTYDGARERLPAFVCGVECVNNTDIAAGNI